MNYLDALVLGLALKEDVGERHLQDQRFRHLFLVPVPEDTKVYEPQMRALIGIASHGADSGLARV